MLHSLAESPCVTGVMWRMSLHSVLCQIACKTAPTHNPYQAFSTQVDIISIDKSYNQGNKVMDPNYNPKVSTWGVFERPANISEAYGGGRTIRAGTPLEDPAVTQARKERMAAALSRCSSITYYVAKLGATFVYDTCYVTVVCS